VTPMRSNIQKKQPVLALLTAVIAVVTPAWTTTSSQQGPPTKTNSAAAIDHVAIHVADLDASVAFYSGVFGFEEIPAAAKGRRWLSLGKGVAIHLLGGRTSPVADNRSVHLALTSGDLEPIMQQLRERKITWTDFAGTAGAVGAVRTDGVRQIFFRDPDGYWIEVNDALKNASK
jgi:lactoylglutathione lyase